MSNYNNKQGEEFYRSLSRKELQSLCKKYGLPARKSSSEMATSLCSYFQVQAPVNLIGHVIKDNFRLRSCPREEGSKGNRNITGNELESCLEHRAYNKEACGHSIDYFQGASQSLFISRCAGNDVIYKEPLSILNGRVEDTPQCCCRNINIGVCPKENISSAIRTYTKVPASFEFYVNSEEGIKLCVDLNSSPSDWIKKYNNQISLCNNVGNAKSQSLHQELGRIEESNKQMRSSITASVDPGQINDDHIQAELSPSFNLEKNNIGIDLPNGGNKSSVPSPARLCSVVHAEGSGCIEEDEGLIAPKPSSGMQKQIISNTESCSKIGSTASSDLQKQIHFNTDSCTKNGSSATIDSDVMDTPTEKTACNFVVSSISDGSVNLNAIERQNSKHDDEVCKNSKRQNCSNLENNCVMLPGCIASCSAEMQLSEAGNYCKDTSCSPNKNGEFLDLDDSKNNIGTEQAALATSSENNHCGSHLPSCSEERDSSNIANGRESSVYVHFRGSQVDNSDEKTCLKYENQESNEEFSRKRPFVDSESQNSYSKRDAKILRSMKHSIIGEVLPRRSLRLVSKFMSCALPLFPECIGSQTIPLPYGAETMGTHPC
ncbi:uncharacterized protein LOC8280414 isoform X3 [Ricinus communis]|uniref:uncharacterized protein LOC8280414 isoform X3 n=1 Tax=Ricinus communis TaxID=3988 RepID=UPI000D68CDFD|nr:uncharacterized protein LOC8280414 isoform X3 [Ricinus communis]|eukprot:XP_025015597.1 uncharacterized protein LOC8280414 isoform X3 [Ricinus communis]